MGGDGSTVRVIRGVESGMYMRRARGTFHDLLIGHLLSVSFCLCLLPPPPPILLGRPQRRRRQPLLAAIMKFLDCNVELGCAGTIEFVPQGEDDMWRLYNLIRTNTNDRVSGTTTKKIAERGVRIKSITVEIAVENMEYDKEDSILHVRGKNLSESQYLKVGKYHNLKIEPINGRSFKLKKDLWDRESLHILQQARDPVAASGSDLAVILMQEGLANMFLIGKTKKARCCFTRERPIQQRKHGNDMKGFFECVFKAMVKHVDLESVGCLVIASPGFTKDQFRKYMLLRAEEQQMKSITKKKTCLVLASSGHKHSLKEVLDGASGVREMVAKGSSMAAQEEGRCLKEFRDMMSKESDRVCYGPKHVEVAHERLAVRTLLVTDAWFRSPDAKVRGRYARLVESVKASGGTAVIFSSMDQSGKELDQLTGVAAILRFPLPELDDIRVLN